jgi:general secretion pathway protein I
MRKGKAEGFTLLEVAVALALTAGILITVIEAVNYHLSVVERHRAKAAAMMLCKEKLRKLKAKPLDGGGHFDAPYSDYEYLSEMSDGPLPGVGLLTLTVKRGGESAKLRAFFRR